MWVEDESRGELEDSDLGHMGFRIMTLLGQWDLSVGQAQQLLDHVAELLERVPIPRLASKIEIEERKPDA